MSSEKKSGFKPKETFSELISLTSILLTHAAINYKKKIWYYVVVPEQQHMPACPSLSIICDMMIENKEKGGKPGPRHHKKTEQMGILFIYFLFVFPYFWTLQIISKKKET